MQTPWYAILMGAGLIGTALVWGRRFRREPEMVVVYAAALLGALLGAKLAYLLAEWPVMRASDRPWLAAATGKSILGALFGGYLGVLGGKRLVGRRGSTGDLFALVVPPGLVLGRVGCLLHGCCLGSRCAPGWWAVHDAAGLPHLPAAAFEAAFNLICWIVLLVLYRRGAMPGQLFHLYLVAYAVFRLLHEAWRDTPRLAGDGPTGVTGYQMIALALLAFALWRMLRRRRQLAAALVGGLSSPA